MSRARSNRGKRKERGDTKKEPPSAHFGRNIIWGGLGVLVLVAAGIWQFVGRNGTSSVPQAGERGRTPGRDGAVAQAGRLAHFVGAERCADCHRKEYELWKGSTHGLAGGDPRATRIMARFDTQPLRFKDGTVTPTTNAAGDYVFIIEQAGLPRAEVKVDAVVGGGHMYGGGTQSFFKEFPDGTVRFLPFDFIRRENLWFVQLRKDETWAPISEEISLATDLANWPPHRVLGTISELSSCQNCHGSQVSLRYDEQTRRYDTVYQTLQINCESCHGPGRRHVELASQPGFASLADIGMAPLATLSKDRSLTVCFQCHATKDSFRDEDYLPGESLEDYFSLKLPACDETFTIDGRVRSFSYQSGHLFSDCYRNGSMTCVDCHDPHSQQYRDINGRSLTGRFDNRQCTSCHASKALTPERHTHHQPDSLGNLCTSCHMPFLQHAAVGKQLAFARSDHSIPIPRPAFDQALGIENACQKCHAEQGLTWQEAKIKEWYGELKPHPLMVSNLIVATTINDPKVAADLLLVPEANHSMAQLAGLWEYIQRFLRSKIDSVDPAVVSKLMALGRSDDIDLKAMAFMALDVSCAEREEVRTFLADRQKSLGQNAEAVRSRWALTAYYLGNAYSADGDMQNAIRCYHKALAIKADNVVVRSRLALAQLKSGDFEGGINELKRAIQFKPSKAALHFQLAQTYLQLRRVPEAVAALEEGLKYNSEDQKARRLLEQLRR